MTATVAAPAPTAATRPRLRGLAWVTWRQHRIAVLGAVLVLGGFGLLLLVNGVAMHRDVVRLGLSTCGDRHGDACRLPLQFFSQRYSGIALFLPRLLEFLPGVLGVFLGAPLVARELETGTFRFAWTQGRGRTAQLTAKLVLLGGALTALCLAFSQLYTWWFRPWEPTMGRMLAGQSYEVEGIVFAARALFGFLLGAFLGAVIRRTVPAMAATAVGWLAVAWPSVIYLRPLIMSPLTVRADDPSLSLDTSWTIDDWVQDAAGHRLTSRQLQALETAANAHGRVDIGPWLKAHGYQEYVSYQPDGRFWHFQLVETGCYLLLALALGAATLWWVRRRVS